MMHNSLRFRLIAGGMAAIAVALTIAGIGLTLLFERHIARTLAEDLDVHLKQLMAGLDVDPSGRIVVTRPPADPRFADPLSGLYWQVSDERAHLVQSRSLWDATLDLPGDQVAPGEVHRHEIAGPAGARLLVAERRVRLNAGTGPTTVRLAVASDLARVEAAKTAFAGDVMMALALLGLVLAAATAVQVVAGLRPLDALRRAVADIRSGRSRQLATAAPVEVKPLIEEVNALLDAREQEIARSRNRAADLAHGLKTPLAALVADGERLKQKGEVAIAAEIAGAVDAMRRHVDRELARARIRGGIAAAPTVTTAVEPLVLSLVATISRTCDGARLAYDIAVADDVSLPFDRTDLAEVLGNLIENATRHAKTRVRVAAPAADTIVVEDDGPGIPPSMRARVLARGARLDERGDGAGLGLAIVQEVLDAYDWNLDLDHSALGGLKAVIRSRSTA